MQEQRQRQQKQQRLSGRPRLFLLVPLASLSLLRNRIAWLCSGPSQHLNTAKHRTSILQKAQAGELEYFEVSGREGLLKLLEESPPESRTMLLQERILRQANFLEMESLADRPAESQQLLGTWQLAFCGIGAGLKNELAIKAGRRPQLRGYTLVKSVTLQIRKEELLASRSEVVLMKPSGEEETVVEKAAIITNSRADILEEKEGFKRYVKVLFLDEDILILQGRGPSEVYKRVSD